MTTIPPASPSQKQYVFERTFGALEDSEEHILVPPLSEPFPMPVVENGNEPLQYFGYTATLEWCFDFAVKIGLAKPDEDNKLGCAASVFIYIGNLEGIQSTTVEFGGLQAFCFYTGSNKTEKSKRLALRRSRIEWLKHVMQKDEYPTWIKQFNRHRLPETD